MSSGRSVSQWMRNLYGTRRYAWYFIKCAMMFHHPGSVLWGYLSQRSPGDRILRLRNGLTLHLSGHPHDIVSVFITFVREDNATVAPGSTVVDIGANIGAYSVFAASRGARRVLAYEPSREAYDCLVHNITSNGFSDVIIPFRLAVTGRDGDVVRFPVRSSPYNKLTTDAAATDCEDVQTVSLASIVRNGPKVDVLKMDCEGAERDVLLQTGPDVLRRFRAMRLEYHQGADTDIVPLLRRNGFSVNRYVRSSSSCGNIWCEQA